MKNFVGNSGIVKEIWGTTDTTLFVFAGASAEFALNKEVDWLYFTGKLPADPVGRLFSTVAYAQNIIFNQHQVAQDTIGRINSIHHHVEAARGREIPAAAYKDVLYMLMHYSIASYELLERRLSAAEKDEVVDVFSGIGEAMHLRDLPGTYDDWLSEHAKHLHANLENSFHTKDLFKRYRSQLGWFRYYILLEMQKMLVPQPVKGLLELGAPLTGRLLLMIYKPLRKTSFARWILKCLVPVQFRPQLDAMERKNNLQQMPRLRVA